MIHPITIHHLLFAALALMLVASTIWTQVRVAAQPAYAVSHREASHTGPGFTGAFGSSAAVRNLLF